MLYPLSLAVPLTHVIPLGRLFTDAADEEGLRHDFHLRKRFIRMTDGLGVDGF